MTNQEAIKFLQQIYPNGGHCWLDEQRIEAIGMAVKALQEEPVSNPIDFEKELYKAFGQVKDFTLGMRIAKRFYDMGKKSREPVSDDLEVAVKNRDEYKEWQGFPDIQKELIDFAKFGNQYKESVSEDLGEYINELSKQFPEVSFAKLSRIAVRVAKWQKGHLWKPADGDDLPEIDREVVVFTQNFPNDAGIMSVSIAHRPNSNGWDGKSVTTGKVEHYTPKTYGKGGWNIPDVKYWLDVKLPKETEL